MDIVSLLHPYKTEPHYNLLPDETINDLSVDYICNAVSKDDYEFNIVKKIMVNLSSDEKVIKYRSDIFDDLLHFPALRDNIKALLDELEYLRSISKFAKDSDASSIWQLVNRLKEIDVYIKCITDIKESLENQPIKSAGLLNLRKYVSEIYSGSGFPQLKSDITNTLSKVRRLKSITIGVNLDDQLKPLSAGIVSLNDTAYSRSGILKNFISFTAKKEEIHSGVEEINSKTFLPGDTTGETISSGLLNFQKSAAGMAHFNYSETPTGGDSLSDAMKKSVTNILSSIVRELKDTLSKYVNISGYSLINLIPELTYYIKWAELTEKLMKSGCKMCKAELDSRDRVFVGKGIYNLKLGINGADSIVDNDFIFDSAHRIYIMTGPNRGGKTTFTQAVGLIFLLAQNGIFVPAENVSFSPADCIFTHFPADENNTLNLGRLGEESKRFSEIFDKATNKSLILMNESFATTTFNEGLFIANGVLKALKLLGARVIFNTHMHDLALSLDKLNSEIKSDSDAVSLVTGLAEENRTYKVELAPPQGKSYAESIAKKYGVTYEQLKRKFTN